MYMKNSGFQIHQVIYKTLQRGASLGFSFKKRKLMSHKVGKCQRETSSNFELLYKLTFKKKLMKMSLSYLVMCREWPNFAKRCFMSVVLDEQQQTEKNEEAWKGVLLDLYHHGNCESSRPLGAKPWFFPSSQKKKHLGVDSSPERNSMSFLSFFGERQKMKFHRKKTSIIFLSKSTS